MDKYLDTINAAELVQLNIEAFILSYKNGSKCQIGDKYSASIINLSPFGIGVYIKELDSKFSVHISKLSNDRLIYDEKEQKIKSPSCVYSLFDIIEVIASKIDVENIEFDVVK